MKKFTLTLPLPSVILLSVLFLTACKTTQTASTTTATNSTHATAQLHRDNIYLHDSIYVEYKRGSPVNPSYPLNPLETIVQVDTVYLEKWHTRWREREITRTDTITQTEIKTNTVQVRYIPKFYKYSTAFACIVLILLLVKFLLSLYKHFH